MNVQQIIKHCDARTDTDWAVLPEPFHVCPVSATRGTFRWYGVDGDDSRKEFDDDIAARSYVEGRFPGCRFIVNTMGWFDTWGGPPDIVALTVVDLRGREVGDGPVVGWIFGGVYRIAPAAPPPCPRKGGCVPFNMVVWKDAIDCLPRRS